QHNYVGTEHLLLGLISEGSGVASQVLDTLEVDPEKLRADIKKAVGGKVVLPSQPIVPINTAQTKSLRSWYNPEARRTLEHAKTIAETAGNKAIGSEHLLLAVLCDHGTVFSALQTAGLSLGGVRREVFKLVEPDDNVPADDLSFTSQAQKALESAWVE